MTGEVAEVLIESISPSKHLIIGNFYADFSCCDAISSMGRALVHLARTDGVLFALRLKFGATSFLPMLMPC